MVPNANWLISGSGYSQYLLPNYHAKSVSHAFRELNLNVPGLGNIGYSRNMIDFGPFRSEIGVRLDGPTQVEKVDAINFSPSPFVAPNVNPQSRGWNFWSGIGANLKFYNASTAYSETKGTVWDLGTALEMSSRKNGITIGLSVNNVGRSYTNSLLPLTMRLGTSWQSTHLDSITIPGWSRHLDILKATVALDLEKELVRTSAESFPDPWYKAITSAWADQDFSIEWEEVIRHGGLELLMVEILAARIGVLWDIPGNRRELHWGSGLFLPAGRWPILLEFGFYTISEPWEDSGGVRKGQKATSLSAAIVF